MEIAQSTDRDLLADFNRSRDPGAFAAIVDRYIGLVYGAASRQVGVSDADDVTQTVFFILWQRATDIQNAAFLAGWLVKTTRLVSLQARRSERRRLRREQTFAATRPLVTEDSPGSSNNPLTHVLDESLARLGEPERTVITLHYLEQKPLAEVATAIGISHVAARKRASRGLGRLRRMFDRRELAISAPAIVPSLAQFAGQSSPPASLLPQVVKFVTTGGSASSVALAKRAVSSLTASKFKTLAAAILVVCMALLAIFELFHYSNRQDSNQLLSSAQASVANASVPLPADPVAANPIKVGVIVSAMESLKIGPDGAPRGYEKQLRIARDLTGRDIQLFPVVEAGTQFASPLRVNLDRYFHGRQAITDQDSAALKRLDVIVNGEVWDTTANMVNAVDSAVQSGVGLFNSYGLGVLHPGITDKNSAAVDLSGVTEAHFGTSAAALHCQAIADHPVLGSLFAVPDLRLRPMGVYGNLLPETIPLVKVTNMSGSVDVDRNYHIDARYVFYPVVISSRGKGRIVVCNFAIYGSVPFTLQNAGRSEFFNRCVHWLAGRPTQ